MKKVTGKTVSVFMAALTVLIGVQLLLCGSVLNVQAVDYTEVSDMLSAHEINLRVEQQLTIGSAESGEAALDMTYAGSYIISSVESSDEAVAVAALADGKITLEAKASGTAYIKVYAKGVDFDETDPDNQIMYFDTVAVTVTSPVLASEIKAASISSQKYTGKARKPAVTLTYGETKLVKGTDYDVKYSNNTKVGKATATVTLKGEYYGTLTVNFKIIPVIDKKSATVYRKTTATFTVKSSSAVTWKSSDTKIVKVNSKGVVTGVSAGTAYVYATTAGTTFKCKITVKNQSINATSRSMYAAAKYTLKYKGGSGKITWKSSDSSIAKVSSDGVVTAIKGGKVKIYGTRNGVTLKCSITVKNQVLSKTKLTAYVSRTSTLSLKGAVKTVTWKSSNTKIATVSSKGVVKGKSVGKVTITATHNGKKYTCNVTVKAFVPITIDEFAWTMTEDNCVVPIIAITNKTKLDVVKISFDMYFYDSKGKPAYCEYQGISSIKLYVENRLSAGATSIFYWNPVICNADVAAIRIKNVSVKLSDGTTTKLKYNVLWDDGPYYG